MGNKVIVTGSNGQLGTDVVNLLEQSGYHVFGYDRNELDITNNEAVSTVFGEVKPNMVIHCAAHTQVDQAEAEPDEAYKINGIGTRNVAVAAEKLGAKLVYISTDYVFDGTGEEPYNEYQPTSPLGIYGKSKLAGEEFVRSFHSRFFIVRTSWVFGINGNNFVKTMLKLATDRDTLSVVDDQIGCPTYTVDLAATILTLIKTDQYGTYHVSNTGSCSWYEFACAIFEEADVTIKVEPVTTKAFPRPAPRPAYSVFDHMALRINSFPEPRPWREALSAFIKEYNQK